MFMLSRLGATSTAWDATWRVMLVGVGIAFSMPVLAAAAMGSLPQRSAGVGSGALATFRQIGFVLGVAVLVSIFAHTVATQVSTATQKAVTYVNSQAQIPASAKAQIVASLNATAKNAGSGGNPAQQLKDPLGSVSQAPAGSAAAAEQKALSATIDGIYKTHVARAFRWPYYAAALAAMLALPFTVLTGRRLGAHAGHEEMNREERRAAADAAGGR